MSPLAVQLLRRVAVYAFVLAVLLATVPWLLTELGVLGPTVEEEVDAAAHALAAARLYGASEDEPTFAAARDELQRGRRFATEGKKREARRALRSARSKAVEAQRLALALREDGRRQAEAVVKDVDGILNELEDLYAEATPGLEKPEVSRLLSLMKSARQTGGGLFLDYEQGDYARVLAEERGVRDALLSVREQLMAARRRAATN